jgi:2-dehydropantoate 2-reductase
MERLMPVNAAPSVRVGVMGAGAIGCFAGGMLAARGMPVVLIGRQALKERVSAGGLTLTDLKGKPWW